MAIKNGVTLPNTIGQLARLDAQQAFLWFVDSAIDILCSFEVLLVQNAMDTGKPEMAEQIKHEFPELLKSSLRDILPQAWNDFRQLWPKLQLELENGNLKAVDHHWSTINEVLNSMRERGYISAQVCNEELLADILQGDGIARQIPPGHPLLRLLSIENEGEWNKLTPAQRVIRLCVLAEAKHPFFRIASRLIHKWAEDSATSSVSQERMVHGDKALEAIKVKPHENLSNAERLSRLCELVGIEMNTLTDSESRLLLEHLHALDAGYDFASKQGASMQAFFGDKADSKKTQRQQLFKKLRDMRGKVK